MDYYSNEIYNINFANAAYHAESNVIIYFYMHLNIFEFNRKRRNMHSIQEMLVKNIKFKKYFQLTPVLLNKFGIKLKVKKN